MTVDSSGNVQSSNPCLLIMLGGDIFTSETEIQYLFYLHFFKEQEEFVINVRELSGILLHAVIITVPVDTGNYSGTSVWHSISANQEEAFLGSWRARLGQRKMVTQSLSKLYMFVQQVIQFSFLWGYANVVFQSGFGQKSCCWEDTSNTRSLNISNVV